MNHILSYLNASRNFFRDVIPDEHILPVSLETGKKSLHDACGQLVFNSPSATADTYSAAVQLLVTCNVQLLRGPALRNRINPVPGNSDPFVIFGQAVQRDLQIGAGTWMWPDSDATDVLHAFADLCRNQNATGFDFHMIARVIMDLIWKKVGWEGGGGGKGRARKLTCKCEGLICFFGVTQAGNSICGNVRGYRPYFYIKKMAPLPAKRSSNQPPAVAKKRKNAYEPEIKRKFESKPAQLDFDSQGSISSVQSSNSDFKGARQAGAEEKWPRSEPELNLKNTCSSAIPFQLMDLDYIMDKCEVVVRFFGVTQAANSICANVRCYRHYLSRNADEPEIKGKFESKLAQLDFDSQVLDKLMQASSHASILGVPSYTQKLVTDIEMVKGSSLYGYSLAESTLFLKIYLVSPRVVSSCCKALPSIAKNTLVRLMADYDIVGCGWVEMPAEKDDHLSPSKKQSLCQFETDSMIFDLHNFIADLHKGSAKDRH
uniref:3'-5' exodeoxyribonuclease n=1 Tax=Ditylenchus dipsaci TaxID=166011 RepID=A0A915D9N3_9BILA